MAILPVPFPRSIGIFLLHRNFNQKVLKPGNCISTGKPLCYLDAIEVDTLNLCKPKKWTSSISALDDMGPQKSEIICHESHYDIARVSMAGHGFGAHL